MNLFCLIPVEHDATSFYRALQPVSQLRKIMPNLSLYHFNGMIKLSDITHMDVCFIQRPWGEQQHLDLVDYAKNLKIKVWLDYDDNLFEVPAYNPAYASYRSPAVKDNMKRLINMADVITVSTEHLKAQLSRYLVNPVPIHVVPNALNDYLFTEKPPSEQDPDKPFIFWRGSQSHQYDLHNFKTSVLNVSEKHPNAHFHFMGYKPFFILDPLNDKGSYGEELDILGYHSALRKKNAMYSFITLSDNLFNRCKSNIAWIEATYAGAVTFAPEWDEWKKPGVITYKDPEDFTNKLDEVLNQANEPERIKMHQLAWDYIQKNLALSKVNHLRKCLLEEVTA